jgi:hypothetical protein
MPPEAKKDIIADRSRLAKIGRLDKKNKEYDTKYIQLIAGLEATGKSDEQTIAAIKSFQEQVGITIDGIIGKQTDSAIRYLQGLEYFGGLTEKGGAIPTPTARPTPPSTFVSDAGKRPDQLVDTSAITAAHEEGARAIQTSFNTGAQNIATAGSGAGTAISSSVSGAGGAISSAFNTGGASAAAMIRQALAGGVKVNMPTNAIATVDRGSVAAASGAVA